MEAGAVIGGLNPLDVVDIHKEVLCPVGDDSRRGN